MTQYNEIYMGLLRKLWNNGLIVNTRGTTSKELLFEKFTLDDPNDNVITIEGFKTNVAYAEEELKWYYSGSNRIDFSPLIERTWKHFSDDGVHVNSAYGHRIFGKKRGFINQWEWVKKKLKEDPGSRQCVINLNTVSDKKKPTKDFVCTIVLHVLIRNNCLHWLTILRSQDIYYGTRNDVYCFTEMQKRMAKELGVNLGTYNHFCSSLHLYDTQFKKLMEAIK